MGLVPPSCLMLRACDEHNWIVQDDTEVFLFACRCDWSRKGARLTSRSLQKFLPVRPKEWRSSNVASQSQSQLNLSSSIEISPCPYVDQYGRKARGGLPPARNSQQYLHQEFHASSRLSCWAPNGFSRSPGLVDVRVLHNMARSYTRDRSRGQETWHGMEAGAEELHACKRRELL